ncbi:MAG: hypothetical protein AABW91_02105 [Nanoarchaeota archaeon]
MTTVIAVKTNIDGVEGIVMGSDTQKNYIQEGNLSEKDPNPKYKIIYGDRWMLGHAGIVNANLSHFNRFLTSNKQRARTIVEDAINHHRTHGKKYRLSSFLAEGLRVADFSLVNDLNTLLSDSSDKRDSEDVKEDTGEFILAASFSDNTYGLWYVNEYGRLVDPFKADSLEYACIGSGSKRLIEYLADNPFSESNIDLSNVGIPVAIDIVNRLLVLAQKDAFTGSILTADLVILTAEGVEAYGKNIIETLIKTREEEIERLKDKYKSLSQISSVEEIKTIE